jgi:cell division septal protein FtsQ
LIVTVEEREPVALLLARKTCLLSADGLILEEVKKLSDAVLPRIRPTRTIECRVGQPLDDPHLLRGVAMLWAIQEAPVLRQLQLAQVAVETDGSYTLHVAHGRPILRMSPAEPLRQLTRLETALRHRGQELESFAYVDLRFPGRVILTPSRKEGERWGGRPT